MGLSETLRVVNMKIAADATLELESFQVPCIHKQPAECIGPICNSYSVYQGPLLVAFLRAKTKADDIITDSAAEDVELDVCLKCGNPRSDRF